MKLFIKKVFINLITLSLIFAGLNQLSLEKIYAESYGSFTELKQLIDTAEGGVVELDKTYKFDRESDKPLSDGITVDRPVKINGKGYTVDGNELSRAFIITADGVEIENIQFKNCQSAERGGALLVKANTIIRNSVFDTNSSVSGGAIAAYGSERGNIDITISDTQFIENSATSYGGAIWGFYVNHRFDDTTIKNNKANYGGAIYNNYSDTSFHNCIFELNKALTGFGGAVFVNNTDTVFTECTLENNSAENGSGGAVHIGSASGTTTGFKNCVLKNNASNTTGGAVNVCKNGLITTTDTLIFDNTAGTKGGGIYTGNSVTLVCEGNGIYNNHAGTEGTDIYAAAFSMVTLPEATTFNVTYRDTERKIDGWYYDAAENRYDPLNNAIKLTAPNQKSGAVKLAAGYNQNKKACKIFINNHQIYEVSYRDKYIFPVSGEDYYDLGYIDSENNHNIYQPGKEIIVRNDYYFIGIDSLAVDLKQGASVYMNIEHPGLSFVAVPELNHGEPILSDGFTYGMLITANEMNSELYDENLMLDSQEKHGGKVANVIYNKDEWISESDKSFRAGILNLPYADLTRDFIARAYVKINYADGESRLVNVSSLSQPRSIQYVSSMIQNSGSFYESRLNTKEREAVDFFASVQ